MDRAPQPSPTARTSSPRDNSIRYNVREVRWSSRPATRPRPPRAGAVEKRLRPPLQRRESCLNPLPLPNTARRYPRPSSRNARGRRIPTRHGYARWRVSARGNRREASARPAPSKPRGLQDPLRPATPERPHLEFVGARGAPSAAPASPLNMVDVRVVDALLLQHREVHPSHPLSADHLPRSPFPSAQRWHESPRGPLGPHEAWHARQSELGEHPGTLASPPRGRTPEGNGEARAIGLLLHPDRLNPSRGGEAPLVRFCFRLFRSLFTRR